MNWTAMLCNGDCVQNVSLQDELLLGCTLSSGILTETLRHHDKQQRWNDVDPLHTTTHTASVHNPFLSMFFYFQTFGKRQLMTIPQHVFLFPDIREETTNDCLP